MSHTVRFRLLLIFHVFLFSPDFSYLFNVRFSFASIVHFHFFHWKMMLMIKKAVNSINTYRNNDFSHSKWKIRSKRRPHRQYRRLGIRKRRKQENNTKSNNNYIHPTWFLPHLLIPSSELFMQHKNEIKLNGPDSEDKEEKIIFLSCFHLFFFFYSLTSSIFFRIHTVK